MSNASKSRVGVFGGTFDPIHLGHLILAEQAREQARLDQVLFVPAASPPHKQGGQITPFAQRVEMLQLAIAGQPSFQVNQLEKDRPGPSYTADTLAALHNAQPDAEFFLLIGADCLSDLPFWHDPVRIVREASLLVAGRSGWPMPGTEQLREALKLPPDVALGLQTIEAPLIELASRDLRRRAQEGRSLRYLVPRAVECFVRERGLYRKVAGEA